MIEIDYRDHRPIYEQISEKLKNLIISGVLKEGDKIPSVRELAGQIAVNPNTIQKAYKELENENYIYSIRASGYFVAPVSEINERADTDELMKKLTEIITELHFLGTDKKEISEITEKIYKKG